MSDKNGDIFQRVFDVIESRKKADEKASYVASLFRGGSEKINVKIVEEAGEVCEAGLAEDKTHLTHEAADLIFHTFVLLSHKGVTLDDLRTELDRRFGVSGHAEKASRDPKK
ncbi:MAG: phosphoribosyl-ATP diphosphatase [Spirochaetia bacterium]|nr:phosphoribosyl-ATP diphosphatase [Spirochaetia bacterium]